MATHIRCYKCRTFFSIKDFACPDCGTPRRGFSSHLHTSMLNNQLYQQAESAVETNKQYNAIKRGYQIDPPAWAKKRAKQIVADM